MLEQLIAFVPPWAMGIAFIVILVLLILLGIPVTFSIGLTSVLFMLIYGIHPTTIIRGIMYPMQSFPLLGVFLFVFMGVVFEKAGLTEVLVEALQPLVGRFRGGLGTVLVVGCALYGLLTGAVAATAAAFSRILGPAMIKRGYPKGYTSALVSSSAALGAFIPPSIPAIIIATSIGGSVLAMFMVGAALGLLIMVGLVLINLAISYKNGYGGIERVYTRKEVVANALRALPLLSVPLGVLGGIYLGVFSVTEAGAFGAVLSLVVAAAYKRLSLRHFPQLFIESTKTTSVVMLMIAASYVLNYTWSLSGINNSLLNFFMGVARSVDPLVALSILATMLFVLGMFFDVIVLAIAWGSVIVAAFAPFGINIYHIGGLFLLGVLIGTTTPPVGAAVFVVSDALEVKVEDIIKSMKPFYLFYLLFYLLAVFVPDITLWLPRLLGLIR